MKRILLFLVVLLTVVGCSTGNNDNKNEEKNANTEPINEVVNNDTETNNEVVNNDPLNNENNVQDNAVVNNNETNDTEVNTNEDDEALKLQVTKVDEDAGITIDNNDIYKELNNLVKENPEQGDPNDFSVYVVNTLENDEGFHLVLLAINRLDLPVMNISFKYTLGKDTGEYLFEKEPVALAEKDFGSIQVNHAMPFTLEVTEEQLELMQEIDPSNQVVEFDDFKFDYD